MPRWENETFAMETPPADIACKDCKYKKPTLVVMGKKIDRYTHADCEKYQTKPLDIIFKKATCQYHEVDNG